MSVAIGVGEQTKVQAERARLHASERYVIKSPVDAYTGSMAFGSFVSKLIRAEKIESATGEGRAT